MWNKQTNRNENYYTIYKSIFDFNFCLLFCNPLTEKSLKGHELSIICRVSRLMMWTISKFLEILLSISQFYSSTMCHWGVIGDARWKWKTSWRKHQANLTFYTARRFSYKRHRLFLNNHHWIHHFSTPNNLATHSTWNRSVEMLSSQQSRTKLFINLTESL